MSNSKSYTPVTKGSLGDTLKCILSKSPGYKKGQTYEVIADENGTLGLRASDGYFDPLFLLCSGFENLGKVKT